MQTFLRYINVLCQLSGLVSSITPSDLMHLGLVSLSARGLLVAPQRSYATDQYRSFAYVGPSSWNHLALELQLLTSHYMDNRQRDLERIRNFLLFNLLRTTCETDGGKFFKGLSLKW